MAKQRVLGLDELGAAFANRQDGAARSGQTIRISARTAGVAAVGTLALVIPAAATLLPWDSSPRERPFSTAHSARPLSPHRFPTHRIEPASISPKGLMALKRSIAILARPRGERDDLPAAAKAGRVSRDVDPTTIRFATDESGDSFFVGAMAPPSGIAQSDNDPWVCLLGAKAGLTCNPLSSVKKGMSFLAADHMPGQRTGETIFGGIVPNGVEHVSFKLDQDRRITARVENNVWVVRANASATSRVTEVVWLDDAGRAVFNRLP
jgi:hypothetical protein